MQAPRPIPVLGALLLGFLLLAPSAGAGAVEVTVSCAHVAGVSAAAVNDDEYEWSANGTHLCPLAVLGEILVVFDSGATFTDACSGTLRCDTGVQGIAQRGDCLEFYLTTSSGDLPIPAESGWAGAACVV